MFAVNFLCPTIFGLFRSISILITQYSTVPFISNTKLYVTLEWELSFAWKGYFKI